jgi:DNA primase
MAQAKAAWVDFKEIKSRVSIAQILERYGVLDSLAKGGSGDRLSGACPIHGGANKTHFRVSVSKNCWNCFGKCQAGGNVIDFVTRKEDIEFRDAALLIEEWFPGSPSEGGEREAKARFHAPEPAMAAPSSPRALAPQEDPRRAETDTEPNKPLAFALTKLDPVHPYLTERGLTPETIATFELGFCSKGLLRGYAAIPIHNTEGDLVAYAGRWPGTPENGKGKYKLPEGFRKSVELFNYHRASASEAEMPLIVVEGFFDAMKLSQAGYERVVAIMGSSLSETQEQLVLQLCESGDERVILFFDGDEAGQKGQRNALERLSKRRFVRAIELGDATMQPEHLAPEDLRNILPSPEGGDE